MKIKIKNKKTKDTKEVSKSKRLTKEKYEGKQENLIVGEVGGSQNGSEHDWKVNPL